MMLVRIFLSYSMYLFFFGIDGGVMELAAGLGHGMLITGFGVVTDGSIVVGGAF